MLDELKKLGWSQELVAAVGAVAGTVRQSAVEQSLTSVESVFIPGRDFDSVSITLNQSLVVDAANISVRLVGRLPAR